MPTLGERIKTRRLDLGWTQDKLAQQAGISKSFLSDLERDERNVSADYLHRIALALGLTIDYLIEGGDGAAKRKNTRDIKIPPSLARFAEAQQLTFSEAVALLEIFDQILAKRSVSKPESIDDVDWKKMYNGVKEYLK